MKRSNHLLSKSGVKSKVTISISGDVQAKMIAIGKEYGLKLSNMLERAARYYLAEIEDLETAQLRAENPEGTMMTHAEVRQSIGLDN